MSQLDKEQFVCIDCETTGLDVENDRIIEVAVVKFTLSEHLDSFESLIDPECSIPETSIAIHHITPDMVEGKPTIVAVLPHVLHLVGKFCLV